MTGGGDLGWRPGRPVIQSSAQDPPRPSVRQRSDRIDHSLSSQDARCNGQRGRRCGEMGVYPAWFQVMEPANGFAWVQRMARLTGRVFPDGERGGSTMDAWRGRSRPRESDAAAKARCVGMRRGRSCGMADHWCKRCRVRWRRRAVRRGGKVARSRRQEIR